jgi:uncharacterized ParB-like nuclease family protein
VKYKSPKMDFTIKTYKNLLHTLKTRGFSFYTFAGFLRMQQANEPSQSITLCHDIDRLPNNALKMAALEKKVGNSIQ